ncbi:MAG: Arc family DNA-binding protein [Pelagibacterium sp.]|uniref:Arc family DNA-binding protein n=1 Tax=Pelagibacterium sp. TaxID=1967288 RepID=UPI0032EF2C36
MPQDSPSRKLDQYIVRFPDGMRDELKTAAAENNRSLNAEIIARLQSTMEDTFSDAILLERIKELVMAKRISDLFGSEIADAIGLYAGQYSDEDTWHEAAAELMRMGLVAAEILPPDESQPAGGRDIRYWSTPEGKEFLEKRWEEQRLEREAGSAVLDELVRGSKDD